MSIYIQTSTGRKKEFSDGTIKALSGIPDGWEALEKESQPEPKMPKEVAETLTAKRKKK